MKLKTITLEGGEYVINYNNLHRTFGGLIYESDFDTNHPTNFAGGKSAVAERIAGDWHFDRLCAKGAGKKL